MKQIQLILIFISSLLNAQSYKIINTKTKNPLSDAIVYKNRKYLTKSDKKGYFYLSDKCCTKNDTLYFLKNNFDNKKLIFSELKSPIELDSIRFQEIKEVVIKKFNIEDYLKNIKSKLNENYYKPFYGDTAYWQILNSLEEANNPLVYYNDIFVTKVGVGTFTNSNLNLINNFKYININDSKYNQRYILYNNKFTFKNSYIYYPHNLIKDELLLDFITNFKNYTYSTLKTEKDNVIIYFSKKDINAVLITNQSNYNILNFKYEIKNITENSENYKNQKSQKYNILSKKVNYNYKNIDNINYYDASSIDISFVSKNENISFDYIFKRNTITPIEIDNLKKINILTFEYE